MTVYYNEIDPYAAQWLRNLIAAGHIAPGDVDTRSIEDVRPDDLRGYAQCHFFAGIGVWSYALRMAGWPDDQAAWTGSCPCQPFSSAGKGAGFDDERHLWPAWHHLISECRPPVIFGEQVASKDSGDWLDLVHTDLEALDYAFGAIPFPAASVGAPHMRDRLYFVANELEFTERDGSQGWLSGRASERRPDLHGSLARDCAACGLEHAGQNHDASQSQAAHYEQPQAERSTDQLGRSGVSSGRLENHRQLGLAPLRQHHTADDGRLAAPASQIKRLANDPGQRCGEARPAQPQPVQRPADGGAASWANAAQGFWADADWLLCKDGKWRPAEPGTFPLADGAANRVGRLRAYGNAIVAPQAQAFIECVMETIA